MIVSIKDYIPSCDQKNKEYLECISPELEKYADINIVKTPIGHGDFVFFSVPYGRLMGDGKIVDLPPITFLLRLRDKRLDVIPSYLKIHPHATNGAICYGQMRRDIFSHSFEYGYAVLQSFVNTYNQDSPFFRLTCLKSKLPNCDCCGEKISDSPVRSSFNNIYCVDCLITLSCGNLCPPDECDTCGTCKKVFRFSNLRSFKRYGVQCVTCLAERRRIAKEKREQKKKQSEVQIA